jgi:uncharacterized RDD family membrane protein YckC
VAWLIDGLILGAVALAVSLPIYIAIFIAVFDQLEVDSETGELVAEGNPASVVLLAIGGSVAMIVILLGLTYLYEVELLLRRGQTVGKQVMKLQVVPLDPTARLDRGMAAKRFLVEHVAASVVPGLTWVDGLWQLWDKPNRQCLHDKFAATVVIKLDA